MLRPIALLQPAKLAFGQNCSQDCVQDLAARGFKRVLIVASPSQEKFAQHFAESFQQRGLETLVYSNVDREPTVSLFEEVLKIGKEFAPDAVLGIGGGSPLDVAKLVAALVTGKQRIQEVFGIGALASRDVFLACLPTTAGTGSEVSPNAILLDESEQLKKGVISPFLVADATYVDPLLTVSMPPAVTAATGLDALTHCIEAYTNKFAHPYIDVLALEGIRLIAANLADAVTNGSDLEAREAMSLASVYGGICLGPVNTAAVHALAYPLGSEFHVPHGISNAVLLPHVMDFNLPACPERYARVAMALGANEDPDAMKTARQGIDRLHRLFRDCGVTATLSDLNVPESAIPGMASSAMKVTRLLKNNPRELTEQDAEAIYRRAYR